MKYFRLAFTDPAFVIRWSLFALILGIIVYQYRTLSFQDNRVAQIMAAHQENLRLARLRMELQPKPEPVKIAAPKPRKHYVLEGSSKQFNTYQALINGRVYKSGDAVDDFTVHNITMDSATLVHKSTGERRVLKFQGLQLSQN